MTALMKPHQGHMVVYPFLTHKAEALWHCRAIFGTECILDSSRFLPYISLPTMRLFVPRPAGRKD